MVDHAGCPRPHLLDRVRDAIRGRHYSRRTEKAYVAWIKRYIFFHAKRHPAEMGAEEVACTRRFCGARSRTPSSGRGSLSAPAPHAPALVRDASLGGWP